MKKLQSIDYIGLPVVDVKKVVNEINNYRHAQSMILNTSRRMRELYKRNKAKEL